MALSAFQSCCRTTDRLTIPMTACEAEPFAPIERQSYILRVRELAKACCAAWLATEGGRG